MLTNERPGLFCITYVELRERATNKTKEKVKISHRDTTQRPRFMLLSQMMFRFDDVAQFTVFGRVVRGEVKQGLGKFSVETELLVLELVPKSGEPTRRFGVVLLEQCHSGVMLSPQL